MSNNYISSLAFPHKHHFRHSYWHQVQQLIFQMCKIIVYHCWITKNISILRLRSKNLQKMSRDEKWLRASVQKKKWYIAVSQVKCVQNIINGKCTRCCRQILFKVVLHEHHAVWVWYSSLSHRDGLNFVTCTCVILQSFRCLNKCMRKVV